VYSRENKNHLINNYDLKWFICTPAMILCCIIAFVLFMVGEIFLGLLAVAIAIGLGLFPIWYILKKETGVSEANKKQMEDMNSFLHNIILSGIDEKISVLYTYEITIDSWRSTHNMDMNFHTRIVTDKIKSDIRALNKLKSIMTPDQKELCHGVIRGITGLMKDMAQSEKAGEIEDVAKLLS
jgi:hypothetical protein